MTVNPYITARTHSELDPQARNKAWWEKLPMTYEDWGKSDRSTDRARVVENFLESNPWLTRDYFRAFAGKKILEIGCGAGPATCLFAEAGADVTAIDLTDAAVAMTTQNTQGLPVTVRQMDAEAMQFPDATFDHVFSWGVLHHSSRTEVAFREVARVLKPGGTALIMVYNRASLRYLVKGFMWLFLRGKIFRGDSLSTVQRFFTDGYYHRHFTPRELVHALEPLQTTNIAITHMGKKMIPLIPLRTDAWLKRRYGRLLVAVCTRPLKAGNGAA